MNQFISPDGSLTDAGVDLHEHIAKLLTSVAVENNVSPLALSYIAHQAIESVTANMVIDGRTVDRKRVLLFGEVA